MKLSDHLALARHGKDDDAFADLAKSFDGVPAVTGIDLDIPAGQFYSLLGASGCGEVFQQIETEDPK